MWQWFSHVLWINLLFFSQMGTLLTHFRDYLHGFWRWRCLQRMPFHWLDKGHQVYFLAFYIHVPAGNFWEEKLMDLLTGYWYFNSKKIKNEHLFEAFKVTITVTVTVALRVVSKGEYLHMCTYIDIGEDIYLCVCNSIGWNKSWNHHAETSWCCHSKTNRSISW